MVKEKEKLNEKDELGNCFDLNLTYLDTNSIRFSIIHLARRET